jgi:hypothetical protein
LSTGSKEAVACDRAEEESGVIIGLIYLCGFCDDYHIKKLEEQYESVFGVRELEVKNLGDKERH